MKKWVKRSAIVLFAAIFLASTALLAQQLADHAAGAASYDDARQLKQLLIHAVFIISQEDVKILCRSHQIA